MLALGEIEGLGVGERVVELEVSAVRQLEIGHVVLRSVTDHGSRRRRSVAADDTRAGGRSTDLRAHALVQRHEVRLNQRQLADLVEHRALHLGLVVRIALARAAGSWLFIRSLSRSDRFLSIDARAVVSACISSWSDLAVARAGGFARGRSDLGSAHVRIGGIATIRLPAPTCRR